MPHTRSVEKQLERRERAISHKLKCARKDDALGWSAQLSRDTNGHVVIATENVPAAATVTAELRRPIGTKEFASLSFERGEDGSLRSTEPVNSGRWLARVTIASGDLRWDSESEFR